MGKSFNSLAAEIGWGVMDLGRLQSISGSERVHILVYEMYSKLLKVINIGMLWEFLYELLYFGACNVFKVIKNYKILVF